jgi:hypothetical protein
LPDLPADSNRITFRRGESASKPDYAYLSHIGQHIMEGRIMPGVHVKYSPG